MSFEIIAAQTRERDGDAGGDAGGDASDEKKARLRTFTACPTYDWWGFDAKAEPTLSGPHDSESDEFQTVAKILKGETLGFLWQHILCRDTMMGYSRGRATWMNSNPDVAKVFVARGGSNDDVDCEFLSAIMVCEYSKKMRKVHVHLLCSGVPGVGGKLLEYAVSEMEKEPNVDFVELDPLDEAVTFYERHRFVFGDDGDLMTRRWRSPTLDERHSTLVEALDRMNDEHYSDTPVEKPEYEFYWEYWDENDGRKVMMDLVVVLADPDTRQTEKDAALFNLSQLHALGGHMLAQELLDVYSKEEYDDTAEASTAKDLFKEYREEFDIDGFLEPLDDDQQRAKVKAFVNSALRGGKSPLFHK